MMLDLTEVTIAITSFEQLVSLVFAVPKNLKLLDWTIITAKIPLFEFNLKLAEVVQLFKCFKKVK